MPRSQKQRTDGCHADYPPDWPEIALHVKTAAGWRCERCGHPHETPTVRVACDELCTHESDGKQRMLTVHHLSMRKDDCSPANLVALCQCCHLSIQARVDFEQSYMFDLPEWLRWRREAFKTEYHSANQIECDTDGKASEDSQDD